MSDAAAAPAPAPNAAEPAGNAAASVEDTGDEKAPDPEAELEAHVQHAVRIGKNKERAKQAAETKAAKKTAPAKAAPTKAEAKPAGETEAPGETEAEPEPEDKPARGGKTPRQLLEEGDLDAACIAAFGKKAADLNINSARWAEYRKVQRRDKQVIAQREEQVRQLIVRAQGEARELLPLRQARQMFEGGDIEGAVKLAFGADVTDFNRKLLGQFHGKNPEVDAVRAELRAIKDERERERREYAAQLEQQQVQQQQQQFFADMSQQVADSGDPQLVALGQRPTFLRRIYQILGEHYDRATRTTLPVLEAAEMAREEVVSEWGGAFGSRDAGAPAVSVRAGSSPAKPAARAVTTISQHGAAETSAPPRGPHGKTLDEQVREITSQFGQTG